MNNANRVWPDAIDGSPTETATEREANQEAGNDEELTREQQLRSQNRDDLVELGRNALEEMAVLKDERKACNDEMNAVRSKLVTKGIPKEALALIEKVNKMDEDQLDGFWLAVDILSESIGRRLSAQLDMFESQDDAA